MTTNSPNPVDGDVQALIELAKRISDTPLKVISETVVCPGVYSSVTSAEIHSLAKVALAALTADPVAYQYQYASCETWDGFKDWRTEISTEMPPGWMMEAGKVIDVRELYATPPAQLLRPVELPDIEENEPAFKAGLNSLVDCLEDCGDAEQGLRLALRSISEKWNEVKS